MAAERDFDVQVHDAELAWPSFRVAYPEFAAALVAASPDMSDGERSTLRGIQPWFEFVIDSDWFRARVSRSGDPPESELRSLLREELTRSLPRSGRVRSAASVREVMKEARRLAVGVTPEPVFDDVVNEELRKFGWTDAKIRARRELTDAIIRESRSTGRTAPEEHLQNLMFQRIETERMIEIASGIAVRRVANLELSGDDAEQRIRSERLKLIAGLPQKLTEVRGEIAATSALMNHPDLHGLSLQQGFEAGTGFDQVWVRLDGDQRVAEFVIVEAKGPGAALRDTRTKGYQMSAEWVARTALEMVRRGDSGVGTALVEAIGRGRPPVRGFVVTARGDGSAPVLRIAPGTRAPDGYYPLDELRRILHAEGDP